MSCPLTKCTVLNNFLVIMNTSDLETNQSITNSCIGERRCLPIETEFSFFEGFISMVLLAHFWIQKLQLLYEIWHNMHQTCCISKDYQFVSETLTIFFHFLNNHDIRMLSNKIHIFVMLFILDAFINNRKISSMS